MASSRKKQDEKNIKLLRDLASLQHNKYCFDCNQRGPTYVNVTIGSFVCTKCSGILRGLTPPHRVKSISMASFSPEEIELLKNRGNGYCRRTWLGLYEGNSLTDCRDEQVIRDFMIDKYERKRYYLESNSTLTNGIDSRTTFQSINKNFDIKPTPSIPIQPRVQINGIINEKNNKNINGKVPDFVADFGSADIYNAINANKDTINNNAVQVPFANFDNNAIFNSNVDSTSNKLLEDWGFINFDTPFDHTTLFPKCNVNNRQSVTTLNNAPSTNNHQQQTNTMIPPAPPEDRYAALKDLDNALKVQPQIDWSSGSNSSSYSSATPTSSAYSSPSPHSSMYGSPSPDQFVNLFPQQQDTPKVSNPFSSGISWSENGNNQQTTVNPFRSSNTAKVNGFYTTPSYPITNGSPWVPNPFVQTSSSTSNGHSNNPFL